MSRQPSVASLALSFRTCRWRGRHVKQRQADREQGATLAVDIRASAVCNERPAPPPQGCRNVGDGRFVDGDMCCLRDGTSLRQQELGKREDAVDGGD